MAVSVDSGDCAEEKWVNLGSRLCVFNQAVNVQLHTYSTQLESYPDDLGRLFDMVQLSDLYPDELLSIETQSIGRCT